MTDEERELVQMFRDAAGPIRPNKHLVAADLIERLSKERDEARLAYCREVPEQAKAILAGLDDEAQP